MLSCRAFKTGFVRASALVAEGKVVDGSAKVELFKGATARLLFPGALPEDAVIAGVIDAALRG